MSIILKKSKLRQIVINISPFLYCGLTFCRFLFENDILRLFATGAILGFGFVLLYLLRGKIFVGSGAWIVVGVTSFSCLVILLGENFPIGAPLFLMSSIGYAAALNASTVSSHTFRLQFYGYALIFFAYMILGIEASQIFATSRNFISIFLLLVAGFYYLGCNGEKRAPALDVGMLGLFFALWANGRSGIIAFGLMVFLTIAFYPKNWVRIILYVLIMVIGFRLLVPNFDLYNFEIFSLAVERYDRLGLEDVRSEINLDYLIAVSEGVKEIMLGANLESIPLIVSLNGNPHNSYINLHVNYGIFGVLALGLLLVFSLLRISSRKSWLLLILLGGVLFRSLFDVAAFYGPLDVIIYSIFFVSLKYNKYKGKHE